MNLITLAKIGTNKTVSYATEELARYLKMMDKTLFIDQRTYEEYDETVKNVIWVGLNGKVKENSRDDEILINVENGVGIITGANVRAVLIAAYRFLRELGCRWLYPGPDGEFIPQKNLDLSVLTTDVHETPSTPYRAVCSEGETTYEQFYNMIEWLPRVGMNYYYMQFFAPMSNFNLWRKHVHNPFKEAEEQLSFDEVLHCKIRLDEEIAKRSLGYMGVGHQFTMRPFGIEVSQITDINDERLTPEYKECFAIIDGKRGLKQDRLNFTQLCYSRQDVRDIMTDFAVEYCKSHPELTILCFTLADGMNNYCECENCAKYSASEWLVTIVNELDEKLTKAGLDIKIIIGAYADRLWAPEKVKLNNPSRFLLTLCPSSRTYSNALYEMKKDPDTVIIDPYVKNKLNMPHDTETIIAMFNKWQENNPCKTSLFDYHLMWDHYIDPGYTDCARILHRDVTGLDKLGFSSFISCQEHRCAYPTGLPMYSMSIGLWDKNSNFEDICKDYYSTAFGEYGKEVGNYLAKITELFDTPFMRCDYKNDHINGKYVESYHNVDERMDKVEALIDEFCKSHIEPNKDVNPSWKYLYIHAEQCKLCAGVVRAYASEDEARIEKANKAFTDYHFRNADETVNVLDDYYFEDVFKRWTSYVFDDQPLNVNF